MATAKRCHYEVLGLPRECTADEIRSAYRRLALQRHPDKLVQSGLSQADATAQFQELQHAYEVLSDPKERAWYDSHRSQILYCEPNSRNNSIVTDLFSFFSNTVYSGYSDSGKGFYKVYSDVFDRIHANEINFAKKMGIGVEAVRPAPVMGNLDSPYEQVTAFYGYWLGFCTVMDFCWVDEFNVMAGPNRKSRRLMEEENNKVRRRARKEYNDTVRKLGDFVKKRDKRVVDMKVKKNLEMEKKRAEERERKKRLEKERKERVMAYEEPEWAKVEEEEEVVVEEWFEEMEEKKEFYCVLCGKKFKSEKQWKNHEQSKKHKEKVAEFRDSLDDEEDLELDVEEEGEREGMEHEEDAIAENDDQGETDSVVNDLESRIRDGLNVADEETRNEAELIDDDDDEFSDALHAEKGEEELSVRFDDNDDDENDVLEAMMAGQKNRKPGASTHKPKASVAPSQIESESDGIGFPEYNNRKSTRKKRGAKKEKGRKHWEESNVAAANGNYENVNSNGNDNSNAEESVSQHSVENEINGKEGEQVGRNKKISNQAAADKKGTAKDPKSKAKNSSKGRKGKMISKSLGNACETCGEEFESRNKLHQHLGDSGHATLKCR
ncbi:DNAJ protein JJJ1 homolog [Abrus precatorius]|uniref:DNAJ protein JJJ1 homolog n=1 Tax=Abrus precatorius TaxID=3816 RepID=A0A8B8JL55_ABRPR|nr:DNAJ protein JJJ1 homolog [Abrus precatorius]